MMSVESRASIARLALGGVVGVEIAGRAGHFDPVPADEGGQAAEQIDGGDHLAAFAVQFLERRERWRFAQAPQPDVASRASCRRLGGFC